MAHPIDTDGPEISIAPEQPWHREPELPRVKARCPKCRVGMLGFERFGKQLGICYICGHIKEIKPA